MQHCQSSFNSPAHDRRGFSLVELLIVMAVLAIVAALAVPAMRGPLDKGRLTGAAKQLQAALGKARAMAIREGSATDVRYEIFGDRYVIERSPSVYGPVVTVLEDSAESGGVSPDFSAESADAFNSQAATIADDPSVPEALREGQLPTGVTFAEPLLPSGQAANGAVSEIDQSSPAPGSVQVRRWSSPIRFYSSGRTTDHVIRLNGQRGFSVDVTLRGLTAMARCSHPARIVLRPSEPSGAMP